MTFGGSTYGGSPHGSDTSRFKRLKRTVAVSGNGVTDATRSASKPRSAQTSGSGQIATVRSTSKLRTTTDSGGGEINATRSALKPRTTTVTGDGGNELGRAVSKLRAQIVSGGGKLNTTRVTTKTRHTTTHGSGNVSLVRTVHKRRTPSLTVEGAHDATQAFHPVFPDERALDVQWDFNADHMGFASEWFSEDSIIDTESRDGVGVTIGGSLSTTIEVLVEYDKNGDGTPDVTSNVQELTQAYHTLGFDDNRLFGADGWYRVVVRGLRAYDTVNQLDIGAVHANL